jgi:NAD-dependent DNA ligase
MLNGDPEKIVKAHQYLYYVLGAPEWSDYEYDMYFRDNNMYSGGGSDLESSYSDDDVKLAKSLFKH